MDCDSRAHGPIIYGSGWGGFRIFYSLSSDSRSLSATDDAHARGLDATLVDAF